MSTISFFCIRHKPSGFYLPEPAGRMGRGGSHVEPTNPFIDRPRILASELSAKRCLTAWLMGKVHHDAGQDYFGEYYENLSVEKIPSRKREEMEIVQLRVELP